MEGENGEYFWGVILETNQWLMHSWGPELDPELFPLLGCPLAGSSLEECIAAGLWKAEQRQRPPSSLAAAQSGNCFGV